MITDITLLLEAERINTKLGMTLYLYEKNVEDNTSKIGLQVLSSARMVVPVLLDAFNNIPNYDFVKFTLEEETILLYFKNKEEKITITSKGSDLENIDLLFAIENIAKDNNFDAVLPMSKLSHDNESSTLITIRVEKTIGCANEKDIETYRKEVETNYLKEWNHGTSFFKKLKYILGRG